MPSCLEVHLDELARALHSALACDVATPAQSASSFGRAGP